MTKKELSQLRYLDQEIYCQKKQLEELMATASSCTASMSNRSYACIRSDKIGVYGSKIADLVALLEETIEKRVQERLKLERYIQAVEDSAMRQILSMRYIQGYSWRKIAHRVGGNNTEDSVRKSHDRYLAKHCPECPEKL